MTLALYGVGVSRGVAVGTAVAVGGTGVDVAVGAIVVAVAVAGTFVGVAVADTFVGVGVGVAVTGLVLPLQTTPLSVDRHSDGRRNRGGHRGCTGSFWPRNGQAAEVVRR